MGECGEGKSETNKSQPYIYETRGDTCDSVNRSPPDRLNKFSIAHGLNTGDKLIRY